MRSPPLPNKPLFLWGWIFFLFGLTYTLNQTPFLFHGLSGCPKWQNFLPITKHSLFQNKHMGCLIDPFSFPFPNIVLFQLGRNGCIRQLIFSHYQTQKRTIWWWVAKFLNIYVLDQVFGHRCNLNANRVIPRTLIDLSLFYCPAQLLGVIRWWAYLPYPHNIGRQPGLVDSLIWSVKPKRFSFNFLMEPAQNPDSRTKLLLEPELNLEPWKKTNKVQVLQVK